jgi:hypothetical protein
MTYREIYFATREFELTDGKHCFAYGEARYRFAVTVPRAAVTWANADAGFSPAEGATVEVESIYWRHGEKSRWVEADGALYDMLAEVPDAWFFQQIRDQSL